jgi:hypothetical protein
MSEIVGLLLGFGSLVFAYLAWRSSVESKRVAERSAQLSEEQLRLAREQADLARQDREVRLRVVQENWWGADNLVAAPRFLVHNVGMRPVQIKSIDVDTMPDSSGEGRRRGTIAASMCVEEGPEVPGWLRPGETIRLNAGDGARTLLSNGYKGKVETHVLIADALGEERRFPITLTVNEP